MTRVIKAELYKLRHNNAYIGIVILSIAFFIGMNIIAPDQTSSFKSIVASLADIVPIISMLIVVGLAQSDYSEGTMKNIVSSGVSRTSIYFGKLIAAFIATLVIFFIDAVVTIAFAVYGNLQITFDLVFFAKAFILQAFVMLNYTVLFFLIGSLIKSPAFAVVISFLIYMFGGALFGLAGNYLHMSGIVNYELGVASHAVEKVTVSTFALEHFAIITAIIIVFAIIGSMIFKKQDVK